MSPFSFSGGLLSAVLSLLLLGGCQTPKPYDYTNFRAHPPRSILVVPPLNESTELEGTYSYLSTVSRPIAERGYYIFPVAVVDQFLKENGMPTSGEMNQVPARKIGQITGADAVLFIDLRQYGSKYVVLNSVTTVEVSGKARRYAHRDNTVGRKRVSPNSPAAARAACSRDMIAAAITQAINKKTDTAHKVSRVANGTLFLPENTGLPYGPYSPKYNLER